MRRNGDAVLFYASKKAQLPFVSVRPVGDNYDVIAPTVKAKKVYKDLQVKQYHSTGSGPKLEPEEEDLLHALRLYSYGDPNTPSQNYPDIFMTRTLSYADMYKELMQKYRLGSHVMLKVFGPVPEFDDNIKYGDVVIIPSNKMGKASLAMVKDALDTAKGLLDKKGLGRLISGRFRITKLTDGSAASYQYGHGITNLDISGLRRGNAVTSIIHEMGHKFDDENQLRTPIEKKWNEVVRAGNSYTSNHGIKRGDVLTLDPKSYKRFKDIELLVTGVDRGGIKASYTKNGNLYTITIPYHTLDRKSVRRQDGSPLEPSNTNPWFPTKYATASPVEFFAENFLTYVMDEASPEVTAWMESLK